ncbi:MAG: 6-phosphogluconolactonase [Erythrobacter sp.]
MAVNDPINGASDADIAAFLTDRLNAALAASEGKVAIALAGGSTPFPILEALVRQRRLDFARLIVLPTDDRVVAEDHPASNTGKLRALMEPLGAQIVPLAKVSGAQATPPHFAMVWLGMGADGHIASLFPNIDPQIDDPQSVRQITPDPLPPEAPFDRITLTIPALLNSDAMMFVIRGEEKRAVWDAASRQEMDLPVARLLAAAEQDYMGVITCFA